VVKLPQALCGFYKPTVGEIEYYGDKPYPLILRGGKQPNYDSVNIALSKQALGKANLRKNLIVDCFMITPTNNTNYNH
jgi:3-deoxy-7-phosphoheptulonate synthase